MAQQTRVIDAMSRVRDVLVAQNLAQAEQQSQDRRNKASADYDEDPASFQDKMEGSGGFAGPDSKKRRGVS